MEEEVGKFADSGKGGAQVAHFGRGEVSALYSYSFEVWGGVDVAREWESIAAEQYVSHLLRKTEFFVYSFVRYVECGLCEHGAGGRGV